MLSALFQLQKSERMAYDATSFIAGLLNSATNIYTGGPEFLDSCFEENQGLTDIIDEAIKETLKQRKIPNNDTESLTPQDHFYREISRIEEIVNGFQIVSEKATSGNFQFHEKI